MNQPSGTLYGIGVGPGDPELIPVKSTRILQAVDVVFAAASTKNDYSLAVSIARPYIPEATPIRMLRFPMSTRAEETHGAWRCNAQCILNELDQGKDAAFLTLGDSMTYSTYGYVLRQIGSMRPDAHVVTIPGITSYQAAAAAMNTPLVEGEESMLLVSGAQGGDRLRQFGMKPDTVVFLKAYRNVGDIHAAIEESHAYDRCVGISNCGMPDQHIETDIRQYLDRKPDYWTLIIAKRNRERW
ncbi:precorrin-2 C(20)-methyltransferase [Desulfatirhabdium butyrativorans]|uniref:precorrin-2 C(20)-methyltransferase n=1 Tax=Desulfatirhabdium butyrativorans TaxID=340467 RepID=UPI0004261030|nr:precorrin-2 C(20)-methyltransferase [Desulfatirhabdium butyrativorans]